MECKECGRPVECYQRCHWNGYHLVVSYYWYQCDDTYPCRVGPCEATPEFAKAGWEAMD